MFATITRTWPTECEAAFLALIGKDPHRVGCPVMKIVVTVSIDGRRKREGTVTKRMDRHYRQHARYLLCC
jgi:hypothetical protein